MDNIQMVDLVRQYSRLKEEIDSAINEVVSSAKYIKGPYVDNFEKNFAKYLGVNNVISCANGTDALQIALMAIDAKPGDEVIVPAFTYVATAEVIALLKLKPVMVDVDPESFNVTAENIENAITEKTIAIVPVNLYGQSAELFPIMEIANKHNLYVIEDNAQALGAEYSHEKKGKMKTGTIGHIGCTSFFPSKNLGCFGDGGAIYTNNDQLAEKLSMIANHGQAKKYHHQVIGVNSRLDALQANILDAKLNHLNDFSKRRQAVAKFYDAELANIDELSIPFRLRNSTHVFHQYTLKIKNGKRDELKEFLSTKGIPSMLYYPIPLYKQEAFKSYWEGGTLEHTEELCKSVLSLPIHTEMTNEVQDYIVKNIKEFFNG